MGCGQGGFGARLAQRYHYLGVEPDAVSCTVARAAGRGGRRWRRGAPGRRVGGRRGRAVRPGGGVRGDRAHRGRRQCAGRWASHLRPGGWLLLSTPAWQKRFGPADEMVGHFRRYDPPVLRSRLAGAGLTDVELVHFGAPLGYVLEAGRNAVGKRRLASPRVEPRRWRSGPRRAAAPCSPRPPGPPPPRGSAPCRSASCRTPFPAPVPAWWPAPASRWRDGGRRRRERAPRRPRRVRHRLAVVVPRGGRGRPAAGRRRLHRGSTRRDDWDAGADGRAVRRAATAPSSPGWCRRRPGPPRRSASSARTPTRPASSSSRGRPSARTAGCRPASRSTAARCSTPGWTASSSSPAGWSPATAPSTWCAPGRSCGSRSWRSTSTAQVNDGLTLDQQRHTAARSAGVGDPAQADLLGPPRRGSPALDGARRRRATTSLTADTAAPARFGLDGELFAAGRLDNLTSVHAGLRALLAAAGRTPAHVSVLAAFDHEELGSASRSGACRPVPRRRARPDRRRARRRRDAQRRRAFAGSWCVSADAGHAVHPNYPERHDPANRPVPGGGPLLKLNANQRYATDAHGAALWAPGLRGGRRPRARSSSRNNAMPVRLDDRAAHRDPARHPDGRRRRRRCCRCTRPASSATSTTWRRSRGPRRLLTRGA